MPELPEVETICRQLEPLIVGKAIVGIEVFNQKSFLGEKKALIGRKIVSVGRKGKVLIVSLKSDLYIHLKMSGQLQFKKGLKRSNLAEARIDLNRDKHLRVKIKFLDKSELWFIDQRKFGWIADDCSVLPKGIDALDANLTSEKLEEILQSSNRPVKTILLDQSKIAGIGNIYASEILWESKISPFKKGRALSQRQGLALIKSIKKTLTEAIKSGGSTMDDGLYQHVSGESGNYWSQRRVYDREGEPCLRCKSPVKKGVIGQRSTYWCPECQMVR